MPIPPKSTSTNTLPLGEASVTPDKGGIMFKVHVHNIDVMKQLVSGTHPVGKPIYDECVNSMTAWELSKMEM